MSGTLSPDGKWLWNGSEWIPAPPPTTEEVLQQSAPVIDATAQQYNLDPQQLSANTQNFDLNQDNTISEYEAQLSAQSMLTPPQVAYPKPMLNQPSQSNNKKFLAIGITVLLIGAIAFWLLSPSISPISSIHDNDGDGYADSDDKFDDNPTQWADSDGDGFGDNQEQGATQVDNFTNNPTQWADSDGDGFGDNQSVGAINSDAFIFDPSENTDSDGDGIGDNTDAFPNDASETIDSDGDGFGDNSDVFPYDWSEWADSDGDGYGDNEDLLPSGDAYIRFQVNSLEADNSQDYDFLSSPDMYMMVYLDWDCDDTNDETLASFTLYDDYYVNSNDGMYVTTDIDENEYQICFTLKIIDEDDSEDDTLDYVDGQGQYYEFTRYVSQTGTINLVYTSNDYKSVDIDISIYIW